MKVEKGRALILNMKDAMEKYKWIESEKAGVDLGEEACLDWAENHSEQFLNEFREHEGGNLPENLEGTQYWFLAAPTFDNLAEKFHKSFSSWPGKNQNEFCHDFDSEFWYVHLNNVHGYSLREATLELVWCYAYPYRLNRASFIS